VITTLAAEETRLERRPRSRQSATPYDGGPGP
jgi:hypothetical protein